MLSACLLAVKLSRQTSSAGFRICHYTFMLCIVLQKGNTALTLGSTNGHVEVVRVLLDRGADMHHMGNVRHG